MKPIIPLLVVAVGVGVAVAMAPRGSGTQVKAKELPPLEIKLAATKFMTTPDAKLERAIVAGGCFWGTEKYLRQTPGIVATAVGYIGGKTERPTYEAICYENTGHAEAVMVEYDTSVISYRQVLDRFWQIHNPCTLNKQGPDYGDQYRSAIFALNSDQLKSAEESKKVAAKLFKRPIVTEIKIAPRFWMAEDYHQQYSEKTGRACSIDRSDHINP